MRQKKRTLLSVEKLEDRWNPTFLSAFDSLSSTWTLTQIANSGAVQVQTSGGNLILNEPAPAGPPIVLGGEGANLKINMLANTGNQLQVTLNDPLTGTLTVQANIGSRTILFDGTSNTIGKLSLTAGTGNQTVNLASVASMSVGSTATISLGGGNDTINATNNVTVGLNAYVYLGAGNDNFATAGSVTVNGTLFLNGVNNVSIGTGLIVGGNLTDVVTGDNFASSFATGTGSKVTGNFSYYGANRADTVNLGNAPAGSNTIGGNLYVYLGTNILGGDSQVDVSGAVISGNVNVNGSTTFVGGGSKYVSTATTEVDGNILIHFGNGTNSANILGNIGGEIDTPHIVLYTGGSGVDNVVVGLVGLPVIPGVNHTFQVLATLGSGVDSFTLNGGATNAQITKLLINFGLGIDTYSNLFGTYTFPVYLIGLP
jgi:hypothetical protein